MASDEFPEADWKLLKKASSTAYDRHCAASLLEIESLLKKDLSPAEKFDQVSELTRRRSKELHLIFDTVNFSQSNAIMILCSLHNWGLLSAEDLGQFTPGIRSRVQGG